MLCATVLAMPSAGLAACFTKSVEIGSLHAFASKLLLVLLALHAAGALANHYRFRTDVLVKMLPGQGRHPREADLADDALPVRDR